MAKISVNELMEYFEYTLSQCGDYLLDMTDADIGYHLLEEFDVGMPFLGDDALTRLKDAKLITEAIANKSSQLKHHYMSLQNTPLWDVTVVKTAPEWREILELSDDIKKLLDTPKQIAEYMIHIDEAVSASYN